jgi:hypothetical protein
MVESIDAEGVYVVLEGNRRVAAIKILSSLEMINLLGLSPHLTKRYLALAERAAGSLPSEINCVIQVRENANYWIQLKHTGENGGIGIVDWDGRARQRFRGSSPALQAIDMVEKSGLLDDATKEKLPKIAITNIERILNTPDARQPLGVEVKKDKLILKSGDEEGALGRLAIIVSDVANRVVKVTQLDTKEQRVSYAKDVVARPLPTLPAGRGKKGGSTQTPITPSAPRAPISHDRPTLIPRRLKLVIPQPRLNRIYHELQKLELAHFSNSAAVLFRVFVELSVDDYAKRKKVSLKAVKKDKRGHTITVDMSLREKIRVAADDLEAKNACTRDELRGVRSLVANREHVLSVDSLNAYVHNKDYSPAPLDLKANWDSIQVFVEQLWAP